MTERLEGGCACGAVRYRLTSEPFDCGWCHCRTCQLVSGAPAMVFASVPAGDLVWTQGADKVKSLQIVAASATAAICGDCGTPFLMQVDHQPETVDFSVATLDDPDAVTPGLPHLLERAGCAWFETADDLPRHAKFRPDTRGLEGTEPPA